MNEFFKGITLPQPDTLEPLEIKIPIESQKNPAVLDFLKVNVVYILIKGKLRFRNFHRF